MPRERKQMEKEKEFPQTQIEFLKTCYDLDNRIDVVECSADRDDVTEANELYRRSTDVIIAPRTNMLKGRWLFLCEPKFVFLREKEKMKYAEQND